MVASFLEPGSLSLRASSTLIMRRRLTEGESLEDFGHMLDIDNHGFQKSSRLSHSVNLPHPEFCTRRKELGSRWLWVD